MNEKITEAQRLRAEGLIYREIAERMGLSIARVGELCIDPDGTKARERKARGYRQCLGCGKTINKDGRRTDPSVRCIKCNGEHEREMSRAWFFDSVKEWVGRFGTPPSAVDWNPLNARANGMPAKADRYAATGRPWPSTTLVQSLFGSWNAGLDAAGYPPVRPGEYRDGRTLADIAGNRDPVWNRDLVFAALDRWRDEHGKMPTSITWHKAGANHPCAKTVVRVFGSWSTAISEYVEQIPDDLPVAA